MNDATHTMDPKSHDAFSQPSLIADTGRYHCGLMNDNMTNYLPYQPSNPYPSDQLMYLSNRSRSESGSSESSRGSGNSSRSRRRCHRPRGCRGGSNRRRNISGEGMKKGVFNTSSSAYGRPNGKIQYGANNVHSASDLSCHGYHPSDGHSLQGGFYGGDGTRDLSFELPDFTAISTAPHLDGISRYHKLDLERSSGRHELTMDFPPLQNSYSDSSVDLGMGQEEFFTGQRMLPPMARGLLGGTGRARSQQSDQILPPLPAHAFDREETILSGPNPYALNLGTSTTSSFLPKSTIPPPPALPLPSPRLKKNETPIFPTKLGRILSPHNASSLIVGSRNDGLGHKSQECVVDNNDKLNDGYRAERLEKQRQNVQGGSLFVTSPRSFLMGLNKTDPLLPSSFGFAVAEDAFIA